MKYKLLCPIQQPIESLPFEEKELHSLLDFLSNDLPITEATIFKRGTITEEGKLDCCKQDLGAVGAGLLANALKNNTNIKSILLGTGGIGDEGAKQVAHLLTENNHIETVYLGCNYIEATGATHLTQALENNKSVKALWLKRNPIGVEGAKSMAHLLTQNRQLKSLDLVNTHIGLEGLKAICTILIDTQYPLERLYLSGNQIDEKGAMVLAQLLASTSTLQELLLSVNHLGDEGTCMLAEGLSQNQTLTNLGLASNNMGNTGATALFKSLENHPTLQKLDLGYSRSTKVLEAQANQIGDEAMTSFKNVLTKNTTLYHIDLNRNQLTLTGLKLIEKGLENNTRLKTLILGKKFQKHTLAQIKQHLEQNLASNPTAIFQTHQDVKMIKSVYR